MLMKPRQTFISSVIAILVKLGWAKFWSKSCGICTDNLPYTFTGGRRGGMHSHIPNNVMRTDNRISTLDLRHLPCSSQAVCMYHQERGRISDESGFGEDPLQGDDAKSPQEIKLFMIDIPHTMRYFMMW